MFAVCSINSVKMKWHTLLFLALEEREFTKCEKDMVFGFTAGDERFGWLECKPFTNGHTCTSTYSWLC